ncbi:hypothetical protein ACTXP8_27205, partial [Klebsiella pneumoniae]|uniref:hypothetical protein n=1 Tax=Klebsiella pneumoniae TaxID=573 RepID=UPI003FD22332
LTANQHWQSYQPKTNLLLIENEHCFFRYPEFLPVLSQMLVFPVGLSEFDLAYAAGIKIESAENSLILLIEAAQQCRAGFAA